MKLQNYLPMTMIMHRSEDVPKAGLIASTLFATFATLQTGVTALQVATANDREDVGDELAEHMEEMPGQRRISIQVL